MKRRRTVPVPVEASAPRADGAGDSPRQLVYVPVLHCPSDMGAAADKLAAAYVERFGRQHWREFLALVQGFWQAVRAALERLDLDCRRVDLYQDGLPLCGRESEIVAKAAAAGSQNHQLLLELVSRGATLVGTEDPKLLLEEYRSVQAALAPVASASPVARASCPRASSSSSSSAASPSPVLPTEEEEATEGKVPSARKGETPSPREALLAKRDAFIARRIGQTLQPGRTGVLFIGMMHQVETYLPADIVVRRLGVGDLPAKALRDEEDRGQDALGTQGRDALATCRERPGDSAVHKGKARS